MLNEAPTQLVRVYSGSPQHDTVRISTIVLILVQLRLVPQWDKTASQIKWDHIFTDIR